MISSKLKEIRRQKKMTLEDLARRLGTSRQTIHRYENGTITNIPPEKIVLLAEALGTTPSELMGWDNTLYERFNNIMPVASKMVPLLGEIACGEPIYAEEKYGSFMAADSGLDADFCLKAHGDSMTGARIYDGDIVFIRSQNAVDNGEIAAVIINDEATLKRVYFYPEESKLILSPENPRYAPLVYMNDELNQIKILGKAVAFQSGII
ncbi:MAG: helix-turn-helix domain-containing protein [Clostridia bacterium]|nr:helix-turn-helix domain-containing protein [Clostridia bacterium]